jgi:diguanylate cyclase (GGDEF)-like protein
MTTLKNIVQTGIIKGYEPKKLTQNQIQDLLSRGPSRQDRVDILYTFKELERTSLEDSLTGLGNLRALEQELEMARENSDREESNFSLVYLDLDGFKAVNDTYGHGAGDKVLRDVSDILNKCVRQTDRTFRQGGDEFAVILPKTSLIEGLTIAEKIRENIQSQVYFEELLVRGTLGVGNYRETTKDITQLRKYTDDALNHAKYVLGKNKVAHHDGAQIIPFAA